MLMYISNFKHILVKVNYHWQYLIGKNYTKLFVCCFVEQQSINILNQSYLKIQRYLKFMCNEVQLFEMFKIVVNM